jgi:hypothetical protein
MTSEKVFDQNNIFIDLNERVCSENHLISQERVIKITGIGGFPVLRKNERFHLLNNDLTEKFISEELTKALGLGAILTHNNKTKRSIHELGDLCLQKGHFWTFNALNVTVAFINVPVFCELSFSRDGRFHLSWVEDKILPEKLRTFTASAPLKVWKKYLSYKDDDSFLRTHRNLLAETSTIFSMFYPAYFSN